MATTYVEGGVDPLSRLREAIGDASTSGRFADTRLNRSLAEHLSQEAVLLRLPTGTGGATGATAGVALASAKLRLTLARTIVGEDADSLELAPSTKHPRVEKVLDWIGSLGKGWLAGLRIGDDVEWFDPSRSGWSRSLVATGRLAVYGPSINLALTDEPLSAYGDEKDAAAIRFYRLFAAAKVWLGAAGVTDVTRRTSGNVTRVYGGIGALADVATKKAALGLYAV